MSNREIRRRELQKRLAALEQEFKAKFLELEPAGFMRAGSVQRRMMTCGKPGCACATDLRARHGPYFTWTSKKQGKTISRLLSETEGILYEGWIENRQRAERTLNDLYRISDKAATIILKLNNDSSG